MENSLSLFDNDILPRMSTDTLIIFSGVLTALISFSGFPSSWKDWMFLTLGVCIIVLGIVMRRRGKKLVTTLAKRQRRRGVVESVPSEIEPIVTTESTPTELAHVRDDRNEND